MFVPKFSLSFTVLAQKDIDDILAYTLGMWGEKQVVAYKLQLDDSFQKILENPKRMRERKYDIRVYPVKKHRVFYRVDETMVTILRILHERMDEEQYVDL